MNCKKLINFAFYRNFEVSGSIVDFHFLASSPRAFFSAPLALRSPVRLTAQPLVLSLVSENKKYIKNLNSNLESMKFESRLGI